MKYKEIQTTSDIINKNLQPVNDTTTKFDKSVGMDDVIDLKEKTNILPNQNEPSKRLSLHSLSQVSIIKSSFKKHTLFPSI